MAEQAQGHLTETEQRWRRRLGLMQMSTAVLVLGAFITDRFAPAVLGALGLHPLPLVLFLPVLALGLIGSGDEAITATVLRSRVLQAIAAGTVLVSLLVLVPGLAPVGFAGFAAALLFDLSLWLMVPKAVAGAPAR